MKITLEINDNLLAEIAEELEVSVSRLKKDLTESLQGMVTDEMLEETCAEAVDY